MVQVLQAMVEGDRTSQRWMTEQPINLKISAMLALLLQLSTKPLQITLIELVDFLKIGRISILIITISAAQTILIHLFGVLIFHMKATLLELVEMLYLIQVNPMITCGQELEIG